MLYTLLARDLRPGDWIVADAGLDYCDIAGNVRRVYDDGVNSTPEEPQGGYYINCRRPHDGRGFTKHYLASQLDTFLGGKLRPFEDMSYVGFRRARWLERLLRRRLYP